MFISWYDVYALQIEGKCSDATINDAQFMQLVYLRTCSDWAGDFFEEMITERIHWRGGRNRNRELLILDGELDTDDILILPDRA